MANGWQSSVHALTTSKLPKVSQALVAAITGFLFAFAKFVGH
jgi:hypothetical protein